MSRLAPKTNLLYGSLLFVCVLGGVILYRNPNDPGKLGAALAFFLTIFVMIAWIIQLLVDHKAAKQPPVALATDQQKRYKRNRILVAIGLIFLLLTPFLFGR